MLDANVISGNETFDRGIDAFRRAWELDQPEKAKVCIVENSIVYEEPNEKSFKARVC
jgi:hypothetical protein